jgi:hypothetical protein
LPPVEPLPTVEASRSNLTLFGFNFITSAAVASILLLVSSVFLLIRFSYLSWRDLVIYEYESRPARDALHTFVDVAVDKSTELDKRARCQQQLVDHGGINEPEQFKKEQEELQKEIETHQQVVNGASVFIMRYWSLKKLITVFEIGLPLALVIIQLGVAVVKFVHP